MENHFKTYERLAFMVFLLCQVFSELDKIYFFVLQWQKKCGEV